MAVVLRLWDSHVVHPVAAEECQGPYGFSQFGMGNDSTLPGLERQIHLPHDGIEGVLLHLSLDKPTALAISSALSDSESKIVAYCASFRTELDQEGLLFDPARSTGAN